MFGGQVWQLVLSKKRVFYMVRIKVRETRQVIELDNEEWDRRKKYWFDAVVSMLKYEVFNDISYNDRYTSYRAEFMRGNHLFAVVIVSPDLIIMKHYSWKEEENICYSWTIIKREEKWIA